MKTKPSGLQALFQYPLWSALFQRRSRRISKGLAEVRAGSLSYHSTQEPQPLTPLEEALLIAATGVTGVTMPDMPQQTETGENLVGSPLLEAMGRAASSPDNAQGTHFILINDSGTYFLQQPRDLEPFVLSHGELTPEKLIDYTDKCKIKLLDRRLDFSRQYPGYFGRNRYVSNVPGSTILMPIVDMTRQYINGIMYLLSQDDGYRPVFIDDWNFYQKAGVGKWVQKGFLNADIPPIPLGYAGTFRIHVEADLLVQNLLLTIQAMGLGGWVHAGFISPLLLGDPEYAKYGDGLGFRYAEPKKTLRNSLLLRYLTPLPTWRANPVGLDGVLEGYCPPYYNSMAEAVDALLKTKYSTGGVYGDTKIFDKVFKPGLAERYLEEVPHYSEEVIACTKDICTYIYETYGRFPAHVDAIFVPGIWVQAHHLDLEYYDRFYEVGYTEAQANHQHLWHGKNS
jgi:hypothetical protein